MNWTEIKIKVRSEDVETASNIANMIVPCGIYIEDYSHLEEETLDIAHINLIDEKLLKKDRTYGIVHVYVSPEENPMEAISFLEERYRFAGVKNQIMTDKCSQEDWINNWKKYFKPIKVGEKLLIKPVWETCDNDDNRTVLEIEPGIAFGTGTHETTKLCLEMLEKFVSDGDEVLDVGCGSGILSIGAILLGADKSTGVDIDELAVKTANENAKTNDVQDKFLGVCGNLTEKISGKYDIVVANIVADVLVDLTGNIETFMKKDAVYLMSGIIDTRKNDVICALKDKFDVIDEKCDKGWVAIAAKTKT